MATETYSIVATTEGVEMWLRHGHVPGEGPVVRFLSREAAKTEVDFMKAGMVEGEDYDSIEIVATPENPPEVDLAP